MTLKLEVGKTYIDALGHSVKIVHQSDEISDFPYIASSGIHYTHEGKVSLKIKSDLDLVEEFKIKQATPIHTPVDPNSPLGRTIAAGAVKHDQGKARMDLLPTSLLKGVAEVLDFGARKYASHNWRKGMEWSRPYSAALRHLTAWNDGEDKDPESGLLHLKHAACNLAFLIEFVEKEIGKDDRYKKVEGE